MELLTFYERIGPRLEEIHGRPTSDYREIVATLVAICETALAEVETRFRTLPDGAAMLAELRRWARGADEASAAPPLVDYRAMTSRDPRRGAVGDRALAHVHSMLVHALEWVNHQDNENWLYEDVVPSYLDFFELLGVDEPAVVADLEQIMLRTGLLLTPIR